MEYSGVSNETRSFHTRTTAGGRVLRYELTVLQQPERARACGQGAKSSTDRRPVDPPPIIELKIKEGENGEEDVTFKMNANYVIFASLEQARPIAKARGHQEKSTPTVLTGSPAAGMAYLERPAPAGYFIFSDLSVRHEGMYRLNFSLFEELKEPADADKHSESTQDKSDAGALIYRMDVRSQPFTVHSAKKFPGLTPSTDLSRTVAEQGCRVRIRRDVRMRRREQKPGSGGAGGDWDSYEDATAEARARASATPDSRMHTPHHGGNYMEPVPRPRSASNASKHSSYQAASRRTSMQDLKQPQYPHASYPSNAPMTPSGYAHGAPYSPQPYQAPSQPASYAQPPQPATMAPPAYQPASHHAGHSAAPQYYPYGPGPDASHAQHGAYEQRQYAAPSQQYPAQAPPQGPSHHYSSYAPHHAPAMPAHHVQPYASQYGRVSSTPTMPNAHMPAPQRSSSTLPPLNTTLHNAQILEPESPHGPAAESMVPAIKSQKRSYDRVFHDVSQRGSLRNGERPSVPAIHHSPPYSAGGAPSGMPDGSLAAGDDDGDDCDVANLNMKYRRADGRQIRRALPAYP